MPPDAYVKEEEVVPPMPPGAYFKEEKRSTEMRSSRIRRMGARRADKRGVEASDAALHTHTSLIT